MKFQMYYPVKPAWVNQKFGETANLAYYQANGINFTGHNGIDFASYHGRPIYAAHDGIAYYEVDASQGHGVVIRTTDKFDYNGEQAYFKTIYWHFVDPAKDPGYVSPIPTDGRSVQVRAGDVIGHANSTGLSTGDHLHFGLKPMALSGEPDWMWYNIEQTNGYMGAIDPAPYFNGKSAEELFNNNLYFGKKGREVTNLQSRLLKKGYLSTDCITGYFGPKTLGAVVKYQKDNGISPALGFVGPITRELLNNTLSE